MIYYESNQFLITNNLWSEVSMTLTNPILNCDLTVEAPNGAEIHFTVNQLRQILDSLTDNTKVVNRSGVLIMTQLMSYKSIKIHDLKCIIYRTLEQLSYTRIAHQYYEKQLA